jgi:ABC-type multidrug transport system ATPase subunit
MLIVTDLAKRFRDKRVFDHLSFRCGAGQVRAVTGENGAGKSTLLRILAGVVSPDAGAASLAGEPLIGRGARGRRRIGYVPEAADPPARLSGQAVLDLVAGLKGAPPASAELRERLALGPLLPRPIGAMSLGQRRRVCLAAALIGDPALLLLDEPSNGLDAGGIDALIDIAEEATARGAAVVLATHDRELIAALNGVELALGDGGVVLDELEEEE